jgi:diguanylate cyclase (GGDEF)-like protein/PAS domain S-box-containing protein
MASNRSPEDMKRERDTVRTTARAPRLSSVGVSDEKGESKSSGGVIKAVSTHESKAAMPRDDNGAKSNAISRPGLNQKSAKIRLKTAQPDSDKSHSAASMGTPSKRLATGLTLRIVIGMTAVVLAMTLVLGVLASDILNDAALPAHMAQKIRNTLLIWSLGGVAITCVLGALIARQISAPIHRLTRELKDHDIRLYPWSSNMRHEFRELEELSGAMEMLASSVRQRERELSESERKFREAFDLVGIGLTQVDVEGRFVVVNRRFCEMLGYSRDELIGKRFEEITHPDDRGEDEDVAGEMARGEVQSPSLISKQKRYLRKDGSVMWAQRSGVAVRSALGEPLYGLGSIEDVSQYHASQETLRALNESLRAIVETSPLAIYSITPNGIVTLWNPAAERMFGIAEDNVLGKPLPLANGQPRLVTADIRSRVMAGAMVSNVEIVWDANPAEVREISISAAPLRGLDQKIVGILLTCSDITELKRTGRTLDQQLHFTKELLEVLPNQIFYKGLDDKYLGFNRSWEDFMGMRREDWIGKTPHDLLTPDLAALAIMEDRDVLQSGKSVASEVILQDGKGGERQMVKHISSFTSPDGKPLGLIGVLTDITDFKQVKRALEASEGRFQVLTESAMDIVTVLDADGVITYQSPSVRHLLGVDPQQMVGRSQYDFVHKDDVALMRVRFAELVNNGFVDKPFEFRVQAHDGSWRVLESMGKSCLDVPAVRGIVVNTRDVTERRAIEARVVHLAYHDALTGLPNRSLMQDRISGAISRSERATKKFAVMFIDIDNFKNINDSLGHDAGDDLLRRVAHRLSESVRAHDTIARQGGDEFIVLLDELEGHQGATRVAQKILQSLRSTFKVNGADQHVSGSIGIAVYPDDGTDASTLLKNADTAMFHSKSLGKNTFQFFTPQMTVAVKRRAALESSLRVAVKNNNFSLVYQPQIDLNTGAIVAYEALVRWVTEQGGVMMPGEFIPLAEETGLINELGRWVLEESCRQNKAWHDMGLPKRRIAVNLSARQLSDKNFVEVLNAILERTGLAPEYLELEITESQVMRQGEGSVALLNEIAAMGIHLAVDDFGTGYSSLSYLKRLPISKLKIDQSFVRDITVDPNDTAIVVAIINMAKSLDLDVIAEGIETAGQLSLLRAKGCSVGQGYYFSVPLSAKELELMLARKNFFTSAPAVTV